MAKHIVVASTNPVKIEAVRRGFERLFPDERWQISGVSVPSGVRDQPLSRQETYSGAYRRAHGAAEKQPGADFYVGIEGGVEETDGGMQVFAWVLIVSNGRVGKAQTGVFYLPEEVAELIRQGLELGDADDVVFGGSNTKQKNGSIGLLTDDTLDRTEYYAQTVIMALIPFKNPRLNWSAAQGKMTF